MTTPITFYPLGGLPEITDGCDLAGLLISAVDDLTVCPGDILVVTHKIVSKACGLVRSLDGVNPSERAARVAAATGKDPRLVEMILGCSETLHAFDSGILIAERRDGWICCNAGVDASNAGARDAVVLLPEDCDAQAQALALTLEAHFGYPIPVIICDTHGRALRSGTVGVAVGSFGLEPIRRYTGAADRDGRRLSSTQEAVADELAGGATLVMGQGNESTPAVLVRGFAHAPARADSADLRLPRERRLYQIQGDISFPEGQE